jgi:hypothetical protein
MSAPVPGIRPDLPWVGAQWTDGEQISDLKLARRFTDPMNELRDRYQPSGNGLARFFAYNNTPTAVAAGGTVGGWTTVEDNANWFNGNDTYSIPAFQGGLFLISCGLVSNVSAQAIDFTEQGTGLGAKHPSNGGVQAGAYVHTIRRFQLSTDIRLVTNVAFTPAAGFYSFMSVTQLAYDYDPWD